MRISQTVGSTTETYVWDRESGLPLLIDDGTDAYLHAGGVQAEIDGGNAAGYHLGDGLGSTRALTDGSGTVTGTADYAVFGVARAATGQSSTNGYTGEQHDPSTGLTYLRARSYDPATGRFLSADTVQPNAPGTQGYNRYTYTANNPTTWTDPSGHAVSDATTVMQFQINALVGLLIVTAAVCLPALMVAASVGPLGMGIGLVCGFQMLAIGLALIMAITIVLQLILDGWLYFPDGSVPGTPPIVLQPEAIAGAAQTFPSSPQDCMGGAISGITDELIWGILLGPAGPVDLAMAAFVGCMTSGSMWSPGKGGNSVENAYDHWKKHKGEFPELNNAKQYVEAAKEFLTNPPPTALTKVRRNGDVVVYDPVSNVFAVMSKTGEPKTMFKPDPTTHGYPSNIDYFNAQ